MIKQLIEDSRKIVIKIGSNTLSKDEGGIDRRVMRNISDQVHELIKKNKDVVIVSSGAGACGIAAINKWMRKGDVNYKQALCAIGQVELMNGYKEEFERFGIHIAQMLLTRDDFNDQNRILNMRNTLFTLIDEKVIPIINENDTVSTAEIKIGDNDTLAALTAILWDADLLIMLSDIDGLYDKNPKNNGNARFIDVVENVDTILDEVEIEGISNFGTGGILTKIEAAKKVNQYGIPMLLVNGKKEDIIIKLMAEEEKATLFKGE